MTATGSFTALGTTAIVCVGDDARLDEALAILHDELDQIDRACSRFRDDSELTRVNHGNGSPQTVSPLLCGAVAVALDAAKATDGILDPTIGAAVRANGYDRSFADIGAAGPRLGRVNFAGVPGWRMVELDPENLSLRIPAAAELDLGATAKAFAADRAAATIHAALETDVLISLGGDIAVAGAPAGGWAILIADDHRAPLDGPGPVIAISDGGLATSSTTVRNWKIGDTEYHHLIDPRTGTSARTPWRTVSVAASSCVAANTASSTALIIGDAASAWLAERGLPARLVGRDGAVTYVAGWPEDPA
jgi:thiamine biosynthesis lipoprotein